MSVIIFSCRGYGKRETTTQHRPTCLSMQIRLKAISQQARSPADVIAFCAIAIVLCGFGNPTAARSVRLSEKLALGVPVILPSRKRDLPHYMALAVNPVFTGITLGLDDGSAYFVIDPPIAVSPKTNRKLLKLLIQS